MKTKTVIHIVNDGVELMEYFSSKNNTLLQLLFLDLNMQRKKNIECLKEMRAKYEFKDIAIATYFTSLSENDIEETLINGANVYVNKPNSFDELKQA